jgi:hypothetical protein
VAAVAGQALAEEAEDLVGELAHLALLAAHSRRAQHRLPQPGAGAAVGRRRDVLLNRHVQEQPQRLERARDAGGRHAVRREPDQLALVEPDGALVRLVHAGDQVEDGRLAGAVRTDQADHLALVHGQVELGDHVQAAEGLAHAGQLEQRGHVTSPRCAWRRTARPDARSSR